MMIRSILFSFLLVSLSAGGSQAQNDCYDCDTDLAGPDLVNGLDNKQGSAEECQAVCRNDYPAAEYFNWAGPEFFNPTYHGACTCKTDKQSTTYEPGVISGPVSCGGTGDCCMVLEFTSSGSLASGVQSHVLGIWEFDSEGPDGRHTYIQPDNIHNPMYLYWYAPLQNWYINDEKDVNMGYALNKDPSSICAEEITNTWEWWDWEVTDEWVLDPTARLTCIFKK